MRIELPPSPPMSAAARAVRRGRTYGNRFALPPEAEEQGEEAAPPAATHLTGATFVSAADAASDPASTGAAQADREAARHGQALLGALAGLQLAALGGGGVQVRQTLSDLARALPEAADPGLDAVLRAIAQRAAIELARAG